MSQINPNEVPYQQEPDVKVQDVLTGTKDNVSDKYGWLTEVEKVIRKMIDVGDDRIEDEFKVAEGIKPVMVDGKKVPEDLMITVYLRDVSKEFKGRWIGERLAVPVKGQWDGIYLMFSDAETKEALWSMDNTRCYKRTFAQFTEDIKPMDVEWLYASWQQAIDYAYLLIADDKISPKLLSDCRNQEIKKYLVKRFGQEKFKNGEGKLVDEEYAFVEEGVTYPIWEEKYWNGEKWAQVPKNVEKVKTGQYLFDMEIESEMHRFVKVNDISTDREYILEVPNTDRDNSRGFGRNTDWGFKMDSVHNAVAGTFSKKNPEEWHPIQES